MSSYFITIKNIETQKEYDTGITVPNSVELCRRLRKLIEDYAIKFSVETDSIEILYLSKLNK